MKKLFHYIKTYYIKLVEYNKLELEQQVDNYIESRVKP